MPTGDYGVKIEGVLAPVTVERKSHADCFASFSGDNYRREKEKIARAKQLGWRYVLVVESTASKIRQGCRYYKGGEWHDVQKDGLSQLKQLLTISQRYQIELALCDGRDDATIFTQELLMTYVRNWEKKVEAS